MIFSDNGKSYGSVNRRKIDSTFMSMNINGRELFGIENFQKRIIVIILLYEYKCVIID
jgi:hypothetical protein